MKKRSYRSGSIFGRRGALVPSGLTLSFFIFVVIALVFIALRLFAPDVLNAIARPLWGLGSGASSGVSSIGSLFGDRAALTRDRDRLVAENLAVTEQSRTLSARVADLERLVGTRTESAHRILAGVLARPPLAPYDTLVIDAGTKSGVHPHAFVFANGGVPLGLIESASADTAHVALYSSPGRVTEGWVGDSRIPITLTGRGAGAFEATLPRASAVAVGDVVYLPGPGALPVGTVVRIDSNPSSPRDTVHIAPYVNVFSLTWVEVSP